MSRITTTTKPPRRALAPERIQHDGESYVDVPRVAEMLKASRSYVYRLIRTGRLPTITDARWPTKPYVKDADVRAVLQRREWWNGLHGKRRESEAQTR